MGKYDAQQKWQTEHMDKMNIKLKKEYNFPTRISEQAEKQGISKAEYITKALIIQLEKDENR